MDYTAAMEWFKGLYLGEKILETKMLWYQCVTLVKRWSEYIKKPTWPFGWSAISGWKNKLPLWYGIDNRLGVRPQCGDILFWAPTRGNPNGHTSLCTHDGGAMWLTHLEQNGWRGSGTGTGSDAIRERRTTYYNLLGWKRAID